MDEIVPPPGDLPAQLRDHEQWVCWRYQERNDKRTKVPVNPTNGSFGSATNPDSWTDFDSAAEYAREGAADGIGFVFTADDSFVGVDLDDCRVPETGTLSDEATEIIETLASYTEVSPSGTGVHVLVRGELPGDRNRHGRVELYDDARFFTVTGDHVPGTPTTVESRPTAIETVYATHVATTETTPDSTTDDDTPTPSPTAADTSVETDDDAKLGDDPTQHQGHELPDEELIKRAETAANSEKFCRLWRGQTTGYDSHSEADMALCALLAFWTGGDKNQMDRLFRQSGLMRDKWDDRHFADGSTYGEKTITRAISGTDEFYDPDPVSSSERKSADENPPRTSDDSTIETVALREELAAATTRTERQLAVISELRTQVEQLEAENRRLKDELASTATDDDQPTSRDDTHSLLTLVHQWIQSRL